MNKLNQLIDQVINYESDDYLLNINIKKDVSDKLLDFQYRHVFNLMLSLRNHNVVLDGSDTGTGKTYVSIAICKQLRLRPLIICPKSIISGWQSVCDYFGIRPLLITNYESIKNGKMYDPISKEIIDCPYLEIDKNFNNEYMFKWKLPKYSIVIFDEIHRCKNPKTTNGKLLMSTKRLHKVLMLSATISDKPESFGIFGYMLGFYNNMKKANGWVKGMIHEDKCYIGMASKLSSINKAIYPDKGSRIRIAELGKSFPDNQITALSYNLDKKVEKEVNSKFNELKLSLKKLESCDEDLNKRKIEKEVNSKFNELQLSLNGLENCEDDLIKRKIEIEINFKFNELVLSIAKLENYNNDIPDNLITDIVIARKKIIIEVKSKINELQLLLNKSENCIDVRKKIEIEINSKINELKLTLKKLERCCNGQKNNILSDITTARKKIEYYKVPIFEDLINNYTDNNFAVVVLVNYRDTLFKLAEIFKTKSIVHGSQTMEDRDNIINDFQNNKTNLIICTMGSGSQCINLHDLHGVPRVSLISPTYKSIELIQSFGRISRAGAKTPALQRIIYCSNTCEEAICKTVNNKLKFTAQLNDNDLIEIN